MSIAKTDLISMMSEENSDLIKENDQSTINERAKYTANTGIALLSTANGELDGSGTLGTVLTAASSGTLIKTITINAITDTSEGMIRLFIYDGGSITKLIEEFQIPPSKKSGTYSSYKASYNVNYNLKSGYIMKASTQNAESFVVIVEGLDWAY